MSMHIIKGVIGSVLCAFFIYVLLSCSRHAYDNGDINERAVLQAQTVEITDIMYGSRQIFEPS